MTRDELHAGQRASDKQLRTAIMVSKAPIPTGTAFLAPSGTVYVRDEKGTLHRCAGSTKIRGKKARAAEKRASRLARRTTA